MKRLYVLLLICLLICAWPLPLLGQTSAAMFRSNARRTGVFETESVARLHGVKWRFKTERVVAWFSSPTVYEGVVYFGSDDSYLYALDARTGELRWEFKTGDVVYSSPAVVAGVVYVGSHDGYLYALDAGTGVERWRFKTGARVYSSPTVSGGVVYFGSAETHLYAVDAATGNLSWRFKAGSWVISSPAVAEGAIYFGSWDSYLYALDVETGRERWKFKTGYRVLSSPVPLQRLVWVKGGRETLHLYATTPNRLATNFACPTASLPSSLLTCPFLIMCAASTPSIVRSRCGMSGSTASGCVAKIIFERGSASSTFR